MLLAPDVLLSGMRVACKLGAVHRPDPAGCGRFVRGAGLDRVLILAALVEAA